MQPESNIAKLSRHYNVSRQTINNWKLDGAPIDDARKLDQWLAARRQPPRFVRPEQVPVRRRKLAVPSAVPLVRGLNASLKRIEEQEAADYQAIEDAHKQGDELRERIARDTWRKSSDQLRRTDLAIEQSRRDAGELIPREEIERLIHALGRALFFALMEITDVSQQLVGIRTPLEAHGILVQLEQLVSASVLTWLQNGKCNGPIPKWMSLALTQATTGKSDEKKIEAEYGKFFEAIGELMKMIAKRPNEKV